MVKVSLPAVNLLNSQLKIELHDKIVLFHKVAMNVEFSVTVILLGTAQAVAAMTGITIAIRISIM